jgi:hypothetical protein
MSINQTAVRHKIDWAMIQAPLDALIPQVELYINCPDPLFFFNAKDKWEAFSQSATEAGFLRNYVSGPLEKIEIVKLVQRLANAAVTASMFDQAFLDLARIIRSRLGMSPIQQSARDTAITNRSDVVSCYLMNWREILDALGMNCNDESRQRVREMNERYSGPIVVGRRGQQPKVEKTKLIEWWNNLEIQWETGNSRTFAQDTVRPQHNYSRGGTVVPGIAGSVKERRTKKKRGT